MLLRPLLGRMAVLSFAIGFGSLFTPPSPHFSGVADGDCRAFTGTSTGNDPSQRVVLHLCRDGETVTGIKSSSGEAGYSAFHLRGVTGDDGQTLLEIDEVLDVSTAEGWITCTDDKFSFHWDERTEQLVGSYRSEACNDYAEMTLRPLDHDSRWAAAPTGCAFH